MGLYDIFIHKRGHIFVSFFHTDDHMILFNAWLCVHRSILVLIIYKYYGRRNKYRIYFSICILNIQGADYMSIDMASYSIHDKLLHNRYAHMSFICGFLNSLHHSHKVGAFTYFFCRNRQQMVSSTCMAIYDKLFYIDIHILA